MRTSANNPQKKYQFNGRPPRRRKKTQGKKEREKNYFN